MFKKLQALISNTPVSSGPFVQSDPPPVISHPQPDFENLVEQEQLRQARYSFNLSVVILITSAIFGFAGVGLLLAGKTTQGAIAATSGLVTSLGQVHLRLAKETGDRLAKSSDGSQAKQ